MPASTEPSGKDPLALPGRVSPFNQVVLLRLVSGYNVPSPASSFRVEQFDNVALSEGEALAPAPYPPTDLPIQGKRYQNDRQSVCRSDKRGEWPRPAAINCCRGQENSEDHNTQHSGQQAESRPPGMSLHGVRWSQLLHLNASQNYWFHHVPIQSATSSPKSAAPRIVSHAPGVGPCGIVLAQSSALACRLKPNARQPSCR